MQFYSSNVDFLLSKLFFFGVSSMGLRTMVGSGQKIEDIEQQSRSQGSLLPALRSVPQGGQERTLGTRLIEQPLSLGNSLGLFIFIPKFSGDLFEQNNRNILVLKCEKLNRKSLALYLSCEQNSCGRSVPRRRSQGGFVTRSCPTGGLRDKLKERLRGRLVRNVSYFPFFLSAFTCNNEIQTKKSKIRTNGKTEPQHLPRDI